MKFENEFSVDAPIDEVWKTLLDLERVAPAMPGAEVTEKVDDDNYKVAIKVKLGPMTMNYKGDVTITDKDSASHTAKLNVKVREARGQGNATAGVTMKLDEVSGGTHAKIDADVQLAGKAAAMGRGLIEDVSAKLVDQFASNLQQMLGGSAGEEAASTNGGETPTADQVAAGQAARPQQRERREEPKFERQDSIDAFALAGGVTQEKLKDPKVIVGIVVALLLLRRLLRRG
jgi:carbon monoxide dehydrogenase subunit G